MFRNRSDLITAIIIFGILGRCERVCKKFEWTEKKMKRTDRPTDSRRPATLSSPSSPRQRADRLHFMVCGTTRWKHKTRFGETTHPHDYILLLLLAYDGHTSMGWFFIFIFAIRTEPSRSLTRHVIIVMIILGHWAQCHNNITSGNRKH